MISKIQWFLQSALRLRSRDRRRFAVRHQSVSASVSEMNAVSHIESMEDRVLLAGVVSLLKDINSGPEDPEPASLQFAAGAVNYHTVYFVETAGPGFSLMSSDGTPGGTKELVTFGAGFQRFGHRFAEAPGLLYFTVTDSFYQTQIWQTDGTTDGTRKIPATDDGRRLPNGQIENVIRLNDRNYFHILAPDGGACIIELRDGGRYSRRITDSIGPFDRGPRDMIKSGDAIYFRRNYFGTENETGPSMEGESIWKIDGTDRPPQRVLFAWNGRPFPRLRLLGDINGKLLFMAGDEQRAGLWITEGNTSSTSLVKSDFSGLRAPYRAAVDPEVQTIQRGHEILFSWGTTTQSQLWRTDGTAAGTSEIQTRQNPGGTFRIREMEVTGNVLFLTADVETETGDREYGTLWKLEHTKVALEPVMDVDSGQKILNAAGLTGESSQLYLHGSTIANPESSVWSLYVDEFHIVSNPQRISDMRVRHPHNFAVRGGTLTVEAVSADFREQLWKFTDGVNEPLLISEAPAFNADSEIKVLLKTHDSIWFTTINESGVRELWTTSGTSESTRLSQEQPSAELLALLTDSQILSSSDHASGRILLRRNASTSSFEIWNIEEVGNQLTTSLLLTFPQVMEYDTSPKLFSAEGQWYFTRRNSETYQPELWVTDGTTNGTRFVTSIQMLHYDPQYHNLAIVGRRAFLLQWHWLTRTESLLETDGTPEHTTTIDLENTFPDARDFHAQSVHAANGRLLLKMGRNDFTEDILFSTGEIESESGHRLRLLHRTFSFDNTHGGNIEKFFVAAAGNNTIILTQEPDYPWSIKGIRLYRDSGTEQGNVQLNPNQFSSGFRREFVGVPVSTGNRVFAAVRTDYGISLLSSDGTDDGTTLFSLSRSGDIELIPESMVTHDGLLYFVAISAVTGNQLWVSNGTADGTFALTDSNGSLSRVDITQPLIPMKDGLVFVGEPGNPGNTGNELLRAKFFAPIVLKPSDIVNYGESVNWITPNNWTEHEVWISNLNTKSRVLYETGLLNPTFQIDKRFEAGRHAVWARSRTPSGSFSEWSQASIFDVPLRAPSTASTPENFDIKRPVFVWEPVPEAIGYEIHVFDRARNVPDRAIHQRILTSNWYQYQAKNPLPAGIYEFAVRAIGAAGIQGAWSDKKTFTITPPPEGIRVTSGVINWDRMTAPSGFHLQIISRRDQSIIIDREIASRSTSVSVPKLSPGSYTIRLNAVYQFSRFGIYTSIWKEAPHEVFHSAVQLTSDSTPTANATPLISWKAVPQATSYEISIGPADKSKPVYQRSLPASAGISHQVTEPLTAGTYKFWIRAHFADKTRSAWGPGQTIEIRPAPQVSIDGQNIFWTPVKAATQYELWIDFRSIDDSVQPRFIHERTLAQTAFQLPSQLGSGEYRVWVRAIRSESGSPYVGRWSAMQTFRQV